MTSTRYASFVLGIIISSVTWAFSLYLYSKLSQNVNTESSALIGTELGNSYAPRAIDEQAIKLNKNGSHKFDEKAGSNWNSINPDNGSKFFKNSKKLVKQLQPVPIKPAITLDPGILQFCFQY